MCSLLLEQTSLLKEISMSCSKLNVCRWQHIHLVSILKNEYQQFNTKTIWKFVFLLTKILSEQASKEKNNKNSRVN